MVYFISALVLSLVFTPVAIRLNILDKPNYRKIHSKPTPKAGGLGIFIPFLILFGYYIAFVNYSKMGLGILLVTSFLIIIGVIDDKIELSSKTKFLLQVAAAALSIGFGATARITGISLIDYIISFIWIVGMINATNLIDGLDGLAAGTSGITAVGFLIVGSLLGSKIIVVISIIIIGSIIGFLVFNFHPAKIFMGDTGSLPLGYVLALFGILSINNMSDISGVILPLIMLALPIFDTSLSMFRRYVNNIPIFTPDRSHFYNLLMDKKGIEHKKVVFILYGISAALVALGITFLNINNLFRIIEFIFILILGIFIIKSLDLVKVDKENN